MISPLDSNAVLLPGITDVAINGGVTPVSGVVPVTFTLPTGYGLTDVFVAVDGALLAVQLNGARLNGGRGVVFVDVGAQVAGDHVVAVYASSPDWVYSRTYVSGNVTWNNYSYPTLAVHFAGAAGEVCKITNAAFTLGDFAGFTVAFWMKIDSACVLPAVPVSHYGQVASVEMGWYIRLTAGPQVSLWGWNNTGASSNTAPQSFTLDAWHLVVAGWDGQSNANKLYLSIDDAAYVNTALTPLYVSNLAVPFTVGSFYNNSGPIKGAIDSLGYWHSRLLTQVEVGLLWDGGVGVNNHDITGNALLSSLLTNRSAWYDCDDTGGQNMSEVVASLTCLGQNGVSTYTSVAGKR